ncbi:hypothetical protein N431DRAFT_375338 [Stipitochalara longipes BDJ]|nr:hypothetical protein N431DRAFT_375338 [Stipitochalara longipes BDJ]
MLDENLPTFYIKPSSDNPLSSTIYLSQNGSELQPEYTLRHPDPNLPASKNVYAVALYDSYNPEVLYAEVLVQPEWTQPTLSAAEVRQQNGIPPPPVPIVPQSFTIQLYNPDQQVLVRQIPGTWNSSAHWEFELPQNSFRVPSVSALDRSQSDPTVSDVTPKINFKWKRDGKLSKDITCVLAGKSTDGKKNKEPDITVAMFKGGKNLTVYEPNLHRVDVEDVKGLEVVLLLAPAVIKDIYFNASREMFNIGNPTLTAANARRKNSGPIIGGKPSSSPPMMSGANQPSVAVNKIPASQILPQQKPAQNARPPPADPRTQWEIDAETERLKRVVEREERERERAVREEQRRIKKMLDEEEKARKKQDAEVAKETERLRKQYGVVGMADAPPTPPRPQQQQYQPQSQLRPQPPQQYYSTPARPLSTPSGSYGFQSGTGWPGGAQAQAQRPSQNSPYLQAPGNGAATSSGFFSGLGMGGKKMQKKRSVFF